MSRPLRRLPQRVVVRRLQFAHGADHLRQCDVLGEESLADSERTPMQADRHKAAM
jgi:hypothetical protein